MTHILWVLGAPDPEMAAIESLLRESGEQVTYATIGGRRVDAGSAYQADPVPGATNWVECESPGQAREIVVDHHHPGDPGYGRPPAEFLRGSSIGQVLSLLDAPAGGRREVPNDLVMAAAADHCLAAAYRGECPGVDPDDLMRWRVESRAAFQRRSTSAILADIERARAAIRAAPQVALLDVCDMVTARDLRGQHVPELLEASAREGECIVADGLPGRDGRIKVICQSGSPDQIETFMILWGPSQGLEDIYGDPARGFAGGYLPAPPVEARQ